jgi:hypothetical protein
VAEFALSQIQAIQRTPGAPMPRPAQCQIVTRIASHGVAAQAGVGQKDFLALVDDQPASRVGSRLYTTVAEKRSYTFYSRPRHERIELVTSGLEPGVLLEPTTPAIRATYDPRNNDPTAQEILWSNRDWEALEEVTSKSLGFAGARESPALLFHGAALYETGRQKSGIEEILQYLLQYSKSWTMNFGGVARYYAALQARREGREEHARTLFEQAWEYNTSDRMAELLEKATGRRPEKPALQWLQRRFPVDYAYPAFEVDTPATTSLSETLAGMTNEQLLCVCLLASYRSNGPYSDLLQRWHNYMTYLGDFLAGLHVLTTETKRYPNREFHYECEAKVRALRRPFHLLHEHDSGVINTIEPRSSPMVFLLDRTGTVVYQGGLDAVDIWDALASVSA